MNSPLQRFPAPGKLNLFLHVLGRRSDGMHELQTVFRLIDRCDRIGLRVRDDSEIRFSGQFGEDNLCVRAARLLQSVAGAARGADIELDKQLPVGGGLGGGSSDAATVLLVLNRFWQLNLKRTDLMALGVRLGADVPAFLYGRSALAEGIGERLSALELRPAWYLVLAPQVPVSTKEIFSDAALTRDTKPLKIPPFFPGQGCNDLESVALRRFPEIALHLAWLKKRSPQARMTGSGACVFAEFPREEDAVALHSELPAAMRGFVARGLERHPLHEWAHDQ
ncbi:MAG: 4-(cytidine 5'-diphospho)-2-C-methyl-D-erythritol kinase [Betaproteobacteria bacterium RBG_16_66_20]|nr:MAG: 4-(cytidine 5'-diphospho)-2-C-methyl-D-erythritol kinase [Betaproteobacteria bacterium RBG_16_66_20]